MSAHPRTGVRPRDPLPGWVAVLTLSVVGGVVPLLVAWHFGALGIPRNDDWSYVLAAFRFGETGTIDANGWAAVSLVGQLVLALPSVLVFGRQIVPLQVEVAALGVVGLLAVFDIGRSLLSRRRALFVAVMVAVGPFWAALSASFMTDVPAFALAMVCLALGVRAMGPARVNLALYAVSLVVGLLAATIRDNAVVAPVAVSLVVVWSSRSRSERTAGALGFAALLGSLAAFYLWKSHLAGFQSAAFELRLSGEKAHEAALLVSLLGLLTAPAVLLAGPCRLLRDAWTRAPRASFVVGGLGFTTLALALLDGGTPLGPGNYVARNGTLGSSLLPGERPALVGDVALLLCSIVAAAAVIVLLVAAVPPSLTVLDRLRRRCWDPPASSSAAIVVLAVLGFGSFILLSRLLGNALWDRYLLPVVPLVGVLVLAAGRSLPARTSRRVPEVAGVTALVVLAGLGLVFAANSASFDGNRWEVAEEVAAAVGDPLLIDGGFEWNDYHAGREVFLSDRGDRRGQYCVVLRAEPNPSAAAGGWRRWSAAVWAPSGTQVWIVARQVGDC